jgi:hypothetical protein
MLLCFKRQFKSDSIQNVLIKRANQRIYEDLNIVSIIKQIKKSQYMFNALLSL